MSTNIIPILIIAGTGYYLYNNSKSKKSSQISKKIRPPTEDEKLKGYYFINCDSPDENQKDIIILDKEKAYEHAYRKGLSVEPLMLAEILKKEILDNCFNFDDKEQDTDKKTQKEFDAFLQKTQFGLCLMQYYFTGFLESGNYDHTKDNYVKISKITSNAISSFKEKYDYLDTSKLKECHPKGYSFNIECKLVISNQNNLNRYFYNIGKNIMPLIKDLKDLNAFLFDDCLDLFKEDGTDLGILVSVDKSLVQPLFIGINYLYSGYLEALKKANIDINEITLSENAIKENLSDFKNIYSQQIGTNTDKWDINLHLTPSNL